MKNRILTLVALTALIFTQIQVSSAEDLSETKLGTSLPAKVYSVNNALEVRATVNGTYAPFYIKNLDCHEYTRTYTLKSSENYTYVRPRSRTVRMNKDASVYLRKLFQENEGNTYFKAYGFGIYGNLVGEFYVGGKSVNKLMIEKGLCSYVN